MSKAKAKFYFGDKNAPKPNKPNHIGVTALIRYKDSILLERRSDCGRWAFIGGGLEIEESLEDCVKREIKEETNLNVKKLKLFKVFSDPSRIAKYPDGNILRIISVAYFVEVENIDDMKMSDESFELAFVKLNKLKEIDVVETHLDIREAYLKYIEE